MSTRSVKGNHGGCVDSEKPGQRDWCILSNVLNHIQLGNNSDGCSFARCDD